VRRSTCSGCGSDDLKQFLDLGSSPVADAYTESGDDRSPSYPLQVAVCSDCRLVQLLEVVPHDVLFGTGYSFYTSASAPLSSYHERYADDVMSRWDLRDAFVVEIGCNDGDLLRHFRRVTPHVLGVDPATGPLAVATGRGLQTLNEPFGSEVANRILDERGPARLIVANHVLAHVADASDVLHGVGELLASDGTAMIEVQYLPDLLVNNAFDLVYHEHRNFFSLTTLQRAVERHGLRVVTAQLTDRQGGSLRVTLARGTGSPAAVDELRASESWLESFTAYDGMQGRVERIRARLLHLLHAELDAGRFVAGYGAPAKATTLLNFCAIGAGTLRFVSDSTPAKQGRFIPGTGIEIRSPDSIDVDTVDTFLLLAWNYLPQIVRQHRSFRGRWIVPFPAPIVL
jgi:hypothetical protein